MNKTLTIQALVSTVMLRSTASWTCYTLSLPLRAYKYPVTASVAMQTTSNSSSHSKPPRQLYREINFYTNFGLIVENEGRCSSQCRRCPKNAQHGDRQRSVGSRLCPSCAGIYLHSRERHSHCHDQWDPPLLHTVHSVPSGVWWPPDFDVSLVQSFYLWWYT